MKKLKYCIPLLLIAFNLNAQSTNSGYIPFHEYMLEHNGNLPEQNNPSRDLAYQLIGYTHIVPSSSGWTYADSGSYSYGGTPWVQSGNTLSFTSSDSGWAVNSQFTDITANFGYLYSSTHQTVANNISTNSYQYIYSYDANFNQDSIVYQVWNGTSWANSFQYVNTFDGNNNQITQTLQTYSGGWQNDSQTVSYYNTANLKTESVIEYYNGGNWDSAFKYNYNWDANRNNFQTFAYAWNGSAWTSYALINQGFDGNSNRVSYLVQLWDNGAGAYQNSYSETYTYLLTHVTGFTNFGWNSLNQGWDAGVTISYNYDGNFNLVYEQDDSNTISTGPYATDEYYYYYDTLTVSGVKAQDNDFSASILGNPVNNRVVLSLTNNENSLLTIGIYNQAGQELRCTEQSYGVGLSNLNFDISNLATGAYFLQIVNPKNGAAKLLKFIKTN